MAEENSPIPSFTVKPGEYKEGDYFYSNGKTYVYQYVLPGGKGNELLKPGNVSSDNPFGWPGKFVEVPSGISTPQNPLTLPSPGSSDALFTTIPDTKRIVNPPVGFLAQIQTGTPLEAMAGIDEMLNPSKITLSAIGPATRPTEGQAAYRYPMADGSQGGIAEDADYVLFNFYDYAPPYGKNSGTGPTRDYNQANEYTQVTAGYVPILMYMPEDISTGFTAQWNGKSTSTLGADALRALSREGLGNKTSAAIGALTSAVERTGPLAGAFATQAAMSKLSGDSFSLDDIFGGISGAILNPNTELLFNGIQLRSFSLSFKLVPRHLKEAAEINNIIKQFKKATLPTKSPGSAVLGFNKSGTNKGINAGFIGVPKLVRVAFMHGPAEHKVLPRFKMCAITNVDINYTPDGAYATYDQAEGQPVAISLDIGFQETKICFSDEIDLGDVR